MIANEVPIWVRGIESTITISSFTIFTLDKIRVLICIPLDFNPQSKNSIQILQHLTLTTLLRDGLTLDAASMEQMKWCLDKIAVPRAMAAIG